MRIRKVKTTSGKYAIQVVSKYQGKVAIHKHIGTYDTKGQEQLLLNKAQQYIQRITGQLSFTNYLNSVSFRDIIVIESKPLFTYELFSRCYEKIGFNSYTDQIIKDLVIARLYLPTSKLETQEIMEECFDRTYSLKTIYRHLKKSLDCGIKEYFQKALINFAKNEYNDSLRLVFYDVTTLYFESQVKTTLKNFGFSKDHRFDNTQIVIGLVVTKFGFPLYFDVFTGNTFEGHTFIITVEKIRQLFNSSELTVVADAAMISKKNMDELDNRKIGFIVGARLPSLSKKLILQINQELFAEDPTVEKEDKKIIGTTYINYRLICQYSITRAAKDRFDRDKQINKAKAALIKPSQITSRYRFVQKSKKHKYTLNQKLIDKAKLLEGVKGYLTNTQLDEQVIIDRYHDLWNVEKSFRITKSDLAARPIFHHLDKNIMAHLVIVFAALSITKYIELTTNLTLRRVLKLCGKILTHKIKNTKTGETTYTETVIEDPIIEQKLNILRRLGH